MAETTTTITNAEKAISMESLEEASKLIATKAEVKQQIAEAVTACANITFASTAEVLKLFQADAPETDPPESGT